MKRSFFAALALTSLIAAASTQARAQTYTQVDLNVGGNYNNQNGWFNGTNANYGGGSIGPSTLTVNSSVYQLPFLYCVDIPDEVAVPDDYPKTLADNQGYAAHDGSIQKIANAGDIAYLLSQPLVPAYDNVQQTALQAAIWHLAYLNDGATAAQITSNELAFGSSSYSGYSLDAINNDPTVVADYMADLQKVSTALGFTDLSPYTGQAIWLTPQPALATPLAQGLVTLDPGVPIPEASTLLGFGMMVGGGILGMRRLRSAKARA